MNGYFLVMEEDLYFFGVVQNVDFLVYAFAEDTVIMAFNTYVTILIELKLKSGTDKKRVNYFSLLCFSFALNNSDSVK